MLSPKKVHTVKAETKGDNVDEREMVLGSARRRRRTCKTNPAGGGSDEDPSMLKSVRCFERKE